MDTPTTPQVENTNRMEPLASHDNLTLPLDTMIQIMMAIIGQKVTLN